MPKRTRNSTTNASPGPSSKKQKQVDQKEKSKKVFKPNFIATPENARDVDMDPPFGQLQTALENGASEVQKGECVVYWMRMGDLRIQDNRALSRASEQAKIQKVPLVVLFVISPQDYIAHDRSARRIDFVLRQLKCVKESLAKLHIPLFTITHTPRRTVPSKVIALMREWGSTSLFANFEYEVDELRRDIKVSEQARDRNFAFHLFHNRCIVEPGVVMTKESRTYTVYTPYQRQWLAKLNGNLSHYLEDHPEPSPNEESIHQSDTLKALFDSHVPDSVPGFELPEAEAELMRKVWPVGEDVAEQMLDRFLNTKARTSQQGAVDPLADGAEDSKKKSRAMIYDSGRDKAHQDTTSRLSPYLSVGIISPRQCVRGTMALLGYKNVEASKTSGVGTWVQELAWRDFYTGILVAFPRVSMGRPFQEKYADVVWESPGDENTGEGGLLRAWEEGKTGYPIVDAAMRCLRHMGWMHNRCRMITAMFLTKHLCIDWRYGEKFFMLNLIDGDLASNNGGWQWSASTGVDACPYFRVFNPYSQSEKADPTGDFIRLWVPELSQVRGKEIHHPPESLAKKLGYPLPVVKHEAGRERALRRYKNPGEK